MCCLVYQILADESLPKKTLIHFWESIFVHAIKMVLEDYCTENSNFLNSISEFVKEVQVSVRNDFCVQRYVMTRFDPEAVNPGSMEPPEQQFDLGHPDDYKLDGPLDLNFAMSQFVRLTTLKNSASALLTLYIGLLQGRFFYLWKPRFKTFREKIQKGILQIYKHFVEKISDQLLNNSLVVVTRYYNHFAHEIDRILGNVPRNHMKLVSHLAMVFGSSSLLGGPSHLPLALLPNESPLRLLNFCPAKGIFFTCKQLGVPNVTCAALSSALCLFNQSQRALFWAQSLANRFSLFYEILSANGIEGRLMSNSLVPKLTWGKLSHHVFYLSNLYQANSSAREVDYRKLLRSSKIDFFSEHIALISESQLSPNERKYLNLFQQHSPCKELNLVKLLGEENSEKLTTDSCKNMVKKIATLLGHSNAFIRLVLKEFEPSQALSRTQEQCIGRSMQIYLYSLLPLLKSCAHVLNSLLKFSSSTEQRDKLCGECLSLLSPGLKLMLGVFSELSIYLLKTSFFDSLPRLQFSVCLFYFFYSLKLLLPPPSSQRESLRTLLELNTSETKHLDVLCLFLQKQLFSKDLGTHKSILVLLFDWLSVLHPASLSVSVLNHFSLHLKSSHADSDVFLLTAQFFLKLMTRLGRRAATAHAASSKKIISETPEQASLGSVSSGRPGASWRRPSLRKLLLDSKFLANFSQTMRFLEDPKFLAVNFYDDKARNTTQAHFKLSLELLVKFCEVIGNANGSYNDIYLFLERHSKRIHTVLGLSQIANPLNPKSKPKKTLFEDFQSPDSQVSLTSPHPTRPCCCPSATSPSSRSSTPLCICCTVWPKTPNSGSYAIVPSLKT